MKSAFRPFAAPIRLAGYDCVRLLPVNTNRSARRSRPMGWMSRHRWAVQMIPSIRHPVGIFCYNDCVAADIVDACIEVGIRIPKEAAVLGVDDGPHRLRLCSIASFERPARPGGGWLMKRRRCWIF
jgi:DNA-binding LacI/PurR family transcriptional regulator